MITTDELYQLASDELGVPADTLSGTDDLMMLGMQSLALMKIAGRLRRAGHPIHYAQMALAPTLDAWAELLGLASGGSAPAASVPADSAGQSADPVVAGADQESTPATQEEGEDFALATMQHAYWIGRQRGQRLGGVAAHLYVEFDGAGIDADRLGRAVRRVVTRHPMLRAAFGDNGTQRILDQAPAGIWSVTDLSEADPAGCARQLEAIREAKSHQHLDVSAGQVLDVALTLLPGGAHRLHLDVDMLAADAMSYRRILADLAAYYAADTDDALPPIGYTYREYLAARRSRQAAAEHRQWWQQRLGDLPGTPELPTVEETERVDPTRSIRRHHWLDAERKKRFESAAFGRGLTPAVLLATLFGEVIAQWSQTQRFLLNVPLFHRELLHPAVEELVGDFTNSVLLDVDLTRPLPLAERAGQLARALHGASAHSDHEGLDVLRDLGRYRGAPVTASVVFTSGLNLGELFGDAVTELFGQPVWIISQGPQVDLDFQAAEVAGGMLLNWDVRRDALPPGVVEEMFAALVERVHGVLDPSFDWEAVRVQQPPTAQLRRRAAVNAVLRAELTERTLHHRFFDLARREPGRPALVRGGREGQEEMSYGELAERALRLAATLAGEGVEPGDRVAIQLPRGPEQIVAVLGVLAAGAAYVPIGIDQPAARRSAILDRAQVRLVLAAGPVAAGVPVVDPAAAATVEPWAAPARTGPQDLAYLLFTSGSTGEPKGVQVPHRAAAATVDAVVRRFAVTAADRWIALSALEFDLSVLDIFAALGCGGAVVCLEQSQVRDPDAWCRLIQACRVSVVNAAPGLIGMLADTAGPGQPATVRLVLTGGDRVDAEVGRRLRAAVPGLRFVGLGGTTETAIHSTCHELTDETPLEVAFLPYGRPLDGVALRVVNDRGEDCPDWVPGEIWIGGRGVADGYRGDPERTAERFVEHDGIRWYRTGDRGRYLPDGILDFLGRRDHQVKIRGYRVELGEVEAALKRQPGVTAAVAAVTPAPVTLVAAVAGNGLDAAAVRTAVTAVLPAYMVPDRVEVLDAMPVTRNGKVDRARVTAGLSTASARGAADGWVAPADDVEWALEYILSAVLEVDRFGVESDFFEHGGNSLVATAFVAKVRGLLLAADLRVTDLFEARTLRRLARSLRAHPDAARTERACAILAEVAANPGQA